MRRATENLTVEIHSNGAGPKATLEGGEYGRFLLEPGRIPAMYHRWSGACGDARVWSPVECPVCARPKSEFQDEANLKPVLEPCRNGRETEMRRDEEHSAFAVCSTIHQTRTTIGLALPRNPNTGASGRWREAWPKFNEPPFVVVKTRAPVSA